MKPQTTTKKPARDSSPVTSNLPRGVRNNNPLNIVHGKSAWLGRYEQQDDPRFVQFVAMRYGIRAAMVTLRTYIKEHKCNTVAAIIKRWCPDDTAGSYITTVCKRTRFEPTTVIRFEERDKIIALTEAMSEVECGLPCVPGSRYLNPADFEKAYDIV